MIRVVRARNASPMTLDGTRTFVAGGERPVVIDPGPDDAAHLAAIERALAGVRPEAIVLTHAHPDHSAGAEALADVTGAPIWMGEGALEPPFPTERVGRWLRDGDGAGGLLVVATPGHAPEHLAFFWRGAGAPAGGALFVGDLFMGEGDTTLVAPPEGELGTYLASLERVAALRPGVLYPAHGPPLHDPPAAVARYRRHREARIRQVERALRARPDASADELVEQVYGPALPPALRGAAAASLRAVLAYVRGSG